MPEFDLKIPVNLRMKPTFLIFALLFFCCTDVRPQELKFERSRHILILNSIKDDIKKNYYDPQFRGIDIEKRFQDAEDKIKQDASVGQMSGTIAQVLVDFDDSHLFFVPPGKVNKTKYGFEMQMIGTHCFAMRVHEKSDAYQKGLRIGDEILAVQNLVPQRQNLWLMNYLFRALRPLPTLRLDLRKPDGKQSAMMIEAKVTPGRKVVNLADSSVDINNFIRESETAYSEAKKQFIYKLNDELVIWQMPAFNLSPSEIDRVMDEIKGKKSLILDLRNNGGGRVDTLQRLLGYFFDKDVKIGDEKRRKETNPMVAKTRGKDHFAGKLAVLVDSESGSAAEIFAKVIQFEKRGRIFGDRSAGAVMESRYFPHQNGMDVVVFYGVSVTIADLIMSDGKSLEKVGVTPDETVLPTAADLVSNRDPALSRAAANLGFAITPEQAGTIFLKEKEKYKDEY